MNYQIKISARDKLFFKDAKPLGGSSIGSGAEWPLPTSFHSALLSALHRVYNPSWESQHKNLTEKEKKKREKVRFTLGGLKTYGPFPEVNGEIYFPAPGDLEPDGSIMSPIQTNAATNLPKPLKYSVGNTGLPTKDKVDKWIAASEIEKYLKGEKVSPTLHSDLFFKESAPGVAINAETRANAEHQFYQAEYLRLNDRFEINAEYHPVSMAAFAECEARKYSGETTDVLKHFFASGKQNFIFGGQRGAAYLECVRDGSHCEFTATPIIQDEVIGKYNVKWVLLSPAMFKKGWLPDWVDEENGTVMLKNRPAKRSMSRKEWREKIKQAPAIKARLVAAKILKPTVLSGWKLDPNKDNAGGEPKATRLAVSAGSVYYFECDNEEEAGKLVNELHCRNKSTHYGEQGFGLGICGTWELKHI